MLEVNGFINSCLIIKLRQQLQFVVFLSECCYHLTNGIVYANLGNYSLLCYKHKTMSVYLLHRLLCS